MSEWNPAFGPPAAPPEEMRTTESSIDLGVLSQIDGQRPLPGRQRAINSFTYVLVGLIGLLGSFTAGAWFQREHGNETTGTATGALPSSQGAGLAPGSTIAGAPGLGQGRTGQFGGGGTIGTIKLVDGSNIYVTDQSGNTVKVTTQPGLAVQVTKSGTVADLAVGDSVIIQGTAGTDGVIAATSIQSGVAGPAAGRGTNATPTTSR